MSDDLGKKIKQITDILGQEKLPENIKNLLSLLVSGDDESRDEPPPALPSEPEKEMPEKAVRSENKENTDLLLRAKDLAERLKVENDPRINLLSAIKPFMNSSRQKRINSCIRMLQISNLARYLDEMENK